MNPVGVHPDCAIIISLVFFEFVRGGFQCENAQRIILHVVIVSIPNGKVLSPFKSVTLCFGRGLHAKLSAIDVNRGDSLHEIRVL
jgi:hypothetical protein